MNSITLVFTKTMWNPLSWFIRWVLPRSRFSLALSSHVFIIDNDNNYVEAVFPQGVRKQSKEKALKGLTVVKEKTYQVLDRNAGMEFLEKQIGKKYDLKAGVGLGFNQDRIWDEDDRWYCYELAAATLKNAGLCHFTELSHITETALLALE